MTINCPLCYNIRGLKPAEQEVGIYQLEDLYRQDLGINISMTQIKREFARLFGYQPVPDTPSLAMLHLHRCPRCDLKFFHPFFPGDKDLYQNLDRFPWYYKEDKYEHRHAAQMIRKHHRVLEIGCGRGAFSKISSAVRYVGLEFNDRALAAGQADGIDIRDDTIEYHSLHHPEEYDVVASFQVVEHVTNPGTFLCSAVGCVKPGGLLILSTPSESSWLKDLQDFPLNLPPHHLTRWSDECLTGIAGRLGLEIVELHHEPLDPYHLKLAFVSKITRRLNDWFGIPHALISHSWRHKITKTLARIAFALAPKRVLEPYRQGVGHTVITTYRKKR